MSDTIPIGTPECATNMFKCVWQEEYYGYRCTGCGMFVAFGCEPWAPIDDDEDDDDDWDGDLDLEDDWSDEDDFDREVEPIQEQEQSQ